MKIIYDAEANVYIVKVEDFETTTYLNTNDIAEAKTEFINRMKRSFNDAICEKFMTASVAHTETDVVKMCKSDFDHEWEGCSISTEGSTYVCKKCGAHKFVPIKTKSLKTYLTEPSVVEEIVSNVIKEN